MKTVANTLSPQLQTQLEGLRDITLPDPVSWWPLAAGWWYLIGATLLMFSCVFAYRFIRRRRLSFQALQELKSIQRRVGSNSQQLAIEISVLLHRVVVQSQGTAQAAYSDSQWQQLLCQGKYGLTADVANVLAQAPYNPNLFSPSTGGEKDSRQNSGESNSEDKNITATHLITATERWLRQQQWRT